MDVIASTRGASARRRNSQHSPSLSEQKYDLELRSPIHIAAQELTWLKAHADRKLNDCIGFHRFLPSVVVGRHQAVEREARLDYCQVNKITIARRLTAGGALYLDGGQQCFTLVVNKEALGKTVGDRLANGATILAAALTKFGINAEFKPPNDLQVGGRQKIASVFLAEYQNSALLFGSIIVELDLKSAMQALLVPTEKLTLTGLEHAKERMTSLFEIIGSTPDPLDLQNVLKSAFSEALELDLTSFHQINANSEKIVAPPEFQAWIAQEGEFETKDKVEGATLRSLLGVDEQDNIRTIRFSTDAHFSPDTLLEDLSHHLKNCSIQSILDESSSFLSTHKFESAGFSASDITRLIERSASKLNMKRDLDLSIAQTSGLMLAGQGQDPNLALEKASVMLVPYCAKPNWCKWRHTIDCVECGECEVGDAYSMARERNMEVITITNFEHLADTLSKMKSAGVESYVGMCCGEFFLKRHHAFRDSGMDAVLLDIEGATCYELKEEHLAYAGAFKAEAKLDLDAVRKIMSHVPVKPAETRPCISGILNRPGEKMRERKSHGGCESCGCSKSAAQGDSSRV